MGRLRLPHLRWWGWAGVAAGLLVLYLVALSAGRAMTGDDTPEADFERARRAVAAQNWSLVEPAEREELTRAVDQAWGALRSYRKDYRSGTAAELAAGTPTVVSESLIALDTAGRVTAQHDTNSIAALAPGSGGREQRFEGYRVRTDRPFTNEKGRRVGESELIYQKRGGAWTCTRDIADPRRDPLPGLRLSEGGDGGFTEIDGHRVRAFRLPVGAFGLRSPAMVWVDTETLLVRRQEIESAVRGQREVWTYGDFDAPVSVTPPSGIACQDS